MLCTNLYKIDLLLILWMYEVNNIVIDDNNEICVNFDEMCDMIGHACSLWGVLVKH